MAAPTENTDLPRALVSTIIKNKLAASVPGDDPDKQQKVNLNKDALLAFVESAKVFISYLTATANDICHESKRQIINVDDVFNAMEDIEFSELVGPLKDAVEAFREESKEKNAKKAERTKKRKQEEQAQADQAEAELDGGAEADATEPDAQVPAAEGELGGPREEIEPAGAADQQEVLANAPMEPLPQQSALPEPLSHPGLAPQLPADTTAPTEQPMDTS